MDNKSSEEFTIRSFEDIYTECEPTFNRYEKWRVIGIIFLIIVEGLIIFGMYKWATGIVHFRSIHLKLTLLFIGTMFGVWTIVKKVLENAVKYEVMQTFVNAFGNFSWDLEDYLEYDRVKDSKIFPNCGKGDFCTEDNIYGKYNNLDFLITKLCLSRTVYFINHKNFEGLVIQMVLNKQIDAHIICVEKNFFPITNLKKIKLEDIEWNSKFDVYADNEIEARYFLTTSLMEKIKELRECYNAKHIHFTLENNILMVALDIGPQSLNSCSLMHPVKDKITWWKLYNQIKAVLKLNDIFNNNIL